MRRTTTVLTIISALTIGIAVATALPGASRTVPGEGIWVGMREAADRVGLEEESRQKIRWILTDAWREGAPVRAARREATAELRTLLLNSKPGNEAVMNQIEALGDIATQARKHRIDTLLKIREVLTPAQRDKLRLMQQEFVDRSLDKTLDACAADAEDLCGELPIGGGRLICLIENQAQLSPECREAAVEQIRMRLDR